MRQTVSPTVLTLAACLLISLVEATDFPALESTHLLLRKEVVSSTLFENISPDESGLRYIKPSHWKKLESELLEHPNWTGHPSIIGICAGDFDGDSRPDILWLILMVGIGYIAT